MLTLHHSRSMESLVSPLAERLAGGGGDVWVPDRVVVESRLAAEWLRLELAKANGVAANLEFPFPGRAAAQVLGAEPGEFPEIPEMAWRIFRDLPGVSEKKVVDYLTGDPNGLKRWELAVRLAELFDKYRIHRAREVEDAAFWSRELWQRDLFEAACEPSLGRRTLEFIEDGDRKSPVERITLFGVTYLPPLLLDLFEAAARRGADVAFFVVAPPSGDDADPWMRWGKRNGEFFGELEERVDEVSEHEIEGSDGFAEGLAGCLQRRIAGVGDGGEEACRGGDEEARRDEALRCGLRVVSCHGPRREVEVLHQSLLECFAADPELAPEDVLVAAPDLEPYRAHLLAVFGHPNDKQLRLPLAGGVDAAASRPVASLLADLGALRISRLTAVDFLGLCANRVVQEKFGFEPDDLPLAEELLKESGFCWALDGDDKKDRFGVPANEAHTLRHALDRLIIGLAVDDEDEEIFGGAKGVSGAGPHEQILPVPAVTGHRAETAARLHALAGALRWVVEETKSGAWKARNQAEKAGFFRELLERFVPERPGDQASAADLARVQRALDVLEERMDNDATPEVLFAALEADLAEAPRSRVSLTGGISVCPLRDAGGVPFKVVAVLGLNEGEFPRRDPVLSFDLTTVAPRPGDPSRTQSDLADYLSAVRSAGKSLHLSFAGASQHDSSKSYPPAVPLGETVEVVEAMDPGFGIEEHPLQPFSPRYFEKGSGLFSYSGADRDTAEAILSTDKSQAPPSLFADPVEETEDGQAGGEGRSEDSAGAASAPGSIEITPEELVRFVSDPPKWFVERVVKARFPAAEDDPPTSEPLELDHLSRYWVRNATFGGLDGGRSMPDEKRIRLADGALPPYPNGEDLFDGDIAPVCGDLLAEVGRFTGGANPVTVDVDFTASGVRVRGPVPVPVHGGRMVWSRTGGLKAKYVVQVWVCHLLACWKGALKKSTVMLGLGKSGAIEKKEFDCPDDPSAILEDILDIFREGQRIPQPFFPESARAYKEKGEKIAGENEWNGGWNRPGEKENSMNPRIYQGELPDAWEAPADKIMAPVLERLSDLKDDG